MPAKKSTRAKTSSASKKPAASPESPAPLTANSSRMLGSGTILLVVVCVMGAVMLIAARESSVPVEAEGTPAVVDTVSAPRADVGTASAAKPAPVSEKAPAAAETAASAKSGVLGGSPVTIAGCLTRTDEAFRLTDTDGTAAPKSRSWKSAFLKKGAAPVDVIDPSNRVRLSGHVGHRVSVTGVLFDRQMQVRSLRRVSGSCS